MYRRYPYLHRTYNTTPESKKMNNQNSPTRKGEKDDSRDFVEDASTFEDEPVSEDIPMPNEREFEDPDKRKGVFINSLSRFLPKNISFEDLVVLGLIFILIQEERKDDMLLMVLIYLLL